MGSGRLGSGLGRLLKFFCHTLETKHLSFFFLFFPRHVLQHKHAPLYFCNAIKVLLNFKVYHPQHRFIVHPPLPTSFFFFFRFLVI